jgi:hypothetical protein
MPTREVTPDTTIYIIGPGHEPLWCSAADTPEKAVAESIRGIGLHIEVAPFTIHKIDASTLASYPDTSDGVRRATKEANELRTYDHEEALRLAREGEVEKHRAPPCHVALSDL